jgi:16S rRNA (uracil1498-N3)-methyltransferase
VPLLIERGLVELPVEEVHHAVRTLRCRVGEEAYLSNGQGLLARARFVEIKGERAVLEVLEVWERPGEPPAPIGLVVAFLKAPDRIGWLVEKAVELGATDIFLVPFARSFPRRPSESRLRRIAIAALKQNLRSVLPRIQVCSQWEEVPWTQFERRLFGEIGASVPLRQALPSTPVSTLWVVGPEGDFTPEEKEALRRLGLTGVSLGHLRLRAETAALLYLSTLKTLWGY